MNRYVLAEIMVNKKREKAVKVRSGQLYVEKKAEWVIGQVDPGVIGRVICT